MYLKKILPNPFLQWYFVFSYLISYIQIFFSFLPTCITLHLPTLNGILFLIDHSSRISKSFCELIRSSMDPTLPHNLESSANFSTLFFTLSSKSLINIVNNNGPSIEPCGTPLVTSAQSEYSPFTLPLCLLPSNQFSIQSVNLPIIPASLTFSISISCGTLSNAF